MPIRASRKLAPFRPFQAALLLSTWVVAALADDPSLRRQVDAYRTSNCAYYVANAGEMAWSVIRERAVLAAAAIEDNNPRLTAEMLGSRGLSRLPDEHYRMLAGFFLIVSQKAPGPLWSVEDANSEIPPITLAFEQWSGDRDFAARLAGNLHAHTAERIQSGHRPRMDLAFRPAIGSARPKQGGSGSSDNGNDVGPPPPLNPPGGGGNGGPERRPGSTISPRLASELYDLTSIHVLCILKLIAREIREAEGRGELPDFRRLGEPCGADGRRGTLQELFKSKVTHDLGRAPTLGDFRWAWLNWSTDRNSIPEIVRALRLGEQRAEADPCEDRADDNFDGPEASPKPTAPAPPPVTRRVHRELFEQFLGVQDGSLREAAYSAGAGVTSREIWLRKQSLDRLLDRLEANDPSLDDEVRAGKTPLLKAVNEGTDPALIRRFGDVALMNALKRDRRWDAMLKFADEARVSGWNPAPSSVVLDDGERRGAFTMASLDNMLLLLVLRARLARLNVQESGPDAWLPAVVEFLDRGEAYTPYLDLIDGESVFLAPLATLKEGDLARLPGVERLESKPNRTRLSIRGTSGALHIVEVLKVDDEAVAFRERAQQPNDGR